MFLSSGHERRIGGFRQGIVCRTIIVTFLVIAASLISSGCGPGKHIEALITSKSDGKRYRAVLALQDYSDFERASEALINALKDEEAAVRNASATSLEMHIARCPNLQIKKRILNALVDVLDDAETGMVSIPVYGTLLPGVLCHTSSVRAKALMVLTTAMGCDFGFDKKAWHAEIDERFPT